MFISPLYAHFALLIFFHPPGDYSSGRGETGNEMSSRVEQALK